MYIRVMIQASFGGRSIGKGVVSLDHAIESVSVTANDILLDALMPDNAPPEGPPVQDGSLIVNTTYRLYPSPAFAQWRELKYAPSPSSC